MKSSIWFFFKEHFAAAVLLTGLALLSSCQKKHKPSFVILAVDRLSFNAFSCNDEKNNSLSGLRTLCQESVRYTNAYTTSTQSAAALGSLLSGVYPYQHSLHRSFDRINPDYPLLTEYFKKNGYRTAFWSAGPSILKKTGLSRGFDLFDDSTFLTQPNYTVPFTEQVKLFKSWVEESVDPFFTVIYNADLDSPATEENSQSKLEVFDEKLGEFIKDLKENDLWEKNLCCRGRTAGPLRIQPQRRNCFFKSAF